MAEPFAVATDLTGYWTPPASVTTTTIEAWLGASSTLIRDRVPDIDARIAAGLIDPEVVKLVAVMTALRVLQNPDRVRQITVSTDDSSTSRTIDSAVSSGELYLSGLHLAMLRGAAKRSRQRAFTITPTNSGPWISR